MEGEKGREGSGGGVSTNQPENMEERGAEETLTDSNAPDKTPNQTSERLVCVLSGPWKPRLLSPRYIYTDLHTNSAPSTSYLRLRPFSITWICGTHAWTATVLFTIHHSSAATVGTHPPAEGIEEVSGPGRPSTLVNSASRELHLNGVRICLINAKRAHDVVVRFACTGPRTLLSGSFRSNLD